VTVGEDWDVVTARRSEVARALQQQARAAVQSLDDFLALPDPTFPLSVAAQQALVAETRAHARYIRALIRLQIGDRLLDGAA